jgi:hypothetical protein
MRIYEVIDSFRLDQKELGTKKALGKYFKRNWWIGGVIGLFIAVPAYAFYKYVYKRRGNY